jgi:hypothetical protein
VIQHDSQVRSRSSKLLALITTVLVALGGLFMVPTAAHAAGPEMVASEAPREGGTVTVTGSGFDGSNSVGVYVGIGPAGLPGFYQGSAQLLDTVWVAPGNVEGETGAGKTAPLNGDGTFSITFEVPAFAEGANYALYASKAHGQGFSDPSQNAVGSISYAAAPVVTETVTEWSSVPSAPVTEGASFDLQAIVTPVGAAGTVTFSENGVAIGSATVDAATGIAGASIPALAVGDHSIIASFAPDEAAVYAPSSTGTPVTVTVEAAAPVWSPEVQVFLGDSTTPLAAGAQVYKGDKLTIKGTGFDPAANVGGRGMPIPSTLPQGSYVVFGKFAEAWSPADGVASSQRKAGPQGWVLAESVLNQIPNDRGFQDTVRSQWVPLAEDGSWTAELTLADPKDAATVTGDYGVYTYGAGGVNNKAQETKLALNYTDSERPVDPTFEADLQVFLADGVTPYDGREVKEGDQLVVKGTGYDPYVNKCLPGQITCDLGGIGTPIPSDKPQGTFAVFGHFAENWKPSAGVKSDQRKMDKSNRAWALAEDTLEQDVPAEHRDTIRTEWVDLDPTTGSFTWTVTLKEPADLVSGGKFGIYTYAGGVNTKNAAQEKMVSLNFKGKDRTPTPDPEVTKGGLKWGVKESFRTYVEGGAGGTITMLGAAKRSGGVFEFPQITGGSWNTKTGTGDVRYAGGVGFSGHNGGLALTLADPQITVESATRAVLSAKLDNTLVRLVDIDLSKAKRTEDDGTVTWTGAPSALRADAVDHFLGFYPAGSEMDPVTFTVGAASDVKPTDPVTPKPKPEQPKPVAPAPVQPAQGAQQAGSLTWAVSSGFAGYTTGPIAKGSVTGNGVGGGAGGYVFPQAGSSWNAAAHTGSVQYSGVVTFSGHKGLMNESFGNPVITVNNAASGTISVSGRSYGLNLAVAAKSVGANGEVTWAGAPVAGAISGGGSNSSGSGGGSFGLDPVTFTVGSASGASYGSVSTVSASNTKRTPAATPPATTGIQVVTPAKKLVPGGEIEIEASGFERKERDILVVLYSDPIVLDEAAGADENGTVRWIGTLPEDIEPGVHTITLQGSINAGAVIEIAEKAETAKVKVKKKATTAIAEQAEPVAAGVVPTDDGPVWVWWAAAIALLVIAGATTGLVVVQRRGNRGE